MYLEKPLKCCNYPKILIEHSKVATCEPECPNIAIDRLCPFKCLIRELKFLDGNNNLVAQSFVDVFLNGISETDPGRDFWKSTLPESVKKCVETSKKIHS
jgi:hypothetical protein